MTNVKAINGNILPNEPNPRVVALLEAELEKAKRGDIKAVAIATIDSDGCGDGYWAHQSSYFSLIGAVARLQQRLVSD